MKFSNYTKPDALKIDIDSTHFFNFNSLRCSQFCSKSLQRFCTTATKVILPSTTYKASAVDNFALYVLLTNFCSWKIVLRNLVAQKTLHKKSPHAWYHVNVNCSKLLGVHKSTNPLKMHFIVKSLKVHLSAFLILCPG